MTFDQLVAAGSAASADAVIVAVIWALPTVLLAVRDCSPSGSRRRRRLEPLCAGSFLIALLIQTTMLELMRDQEIMAVILVALLIAAPVMGAQLYRVSTRRQAVAANPSTTR
jgi:hypothetical protein